MKTCENCGLGIPENESIIKCFKYKTLNNSLIDKESCLYYTEIICEEGEPLTPLQHLLLKEEEVKARMMKVSYQDIPII
jgi:hypothetical protein